MDAIEISSADYGHHRIDEILRRKYDTLKMMIPLNEMKGL